MAISTYYEPEIRNIANKKAAKLTIRSMMGSHRKAQNLVEVPAFLTSFNQTFTSQWNEEEVYGRMDPIATFQGTRRSISLTFDLISSNVEIARDNLESCDKIAKFLYPSYANQYEKVTAKQAKELQKQDKKPNVLGQVISKPPLVRVKYANLICENEVGQLGYLSGLDWSPSLDMGMFINGTKLYPKVISLSFTLNVLHQGTKGFGKKGSSSHTWLSNDFFQYDE